MGVSTASTLHTAELRKQHEPEERIAGLSDWRGSRVAYTQRERAALAWTEAVTNIQDGHAPDAVYDEVRAHFSDVETVNLTLAITTINAWNRLAISMENHPGHAGKTRRCRVEQGSYAESEVDGCGCDVAGVRGECAAGDARCRPV
jgi:hypothetical protein